MQIERKEIFSEIKKYLGIDPFGFNMQLNGKAVKVTQIPSSNIQNHYQRYSEYAIALLNNPNPIVSTELFATSEAPVLRQGQPVYYVDYLPDEENFSNCTGSISSIRQDSNGITVLEMDGPMPTCSVPIFVYDEEDKGLKLAGFVSRESNGLVEATHIDLFDKVDPDQNFDAKIEPSDEERGNGKYLGGPPNGFHIHKFSNCGHVKFKDKMYKFGVGHQLTDDISRSNLQEALEKAKEKKRWLLVAAIEEEMENY